MHDPPDVPAKHQDLEQGSATFWRHYMYACVCKCLKRGRELHSVVLEFQLTLAKVGGLDKGLPPLDLEGWHSSPECS